jgi:hypothetical protein
METGWGYVCRHGNGLAVVFGWEGAFPQSDAGLCCFDKLGKAFTTSLGSEDYIYREGWGYWGDVGFAHGSEEQVL